MVASTVVRAYDLGGFGDIAGAMRVASFLHRTGVKTEIKAKSASAMKKLQILNPDVEFSMNGNGNSNGTIQVDVAGHYKDDRNPFNVDVPHHFTEDMDNPASRRKSVPVYMKTGLVKWVPEIPVQFSIPGGNPMFYRPFREWDLPKPGERDVRRQIMQLMKQKQPGKFARILGFGKTNGLERVLDETERIGFAHLSPQIQNLHPAEILEHPYFYGVHTAKLEHDRTFGIGLFLGSSLERELTAVALQKYWNVVSSNGEVLKYNSDLPTLIFLGQQPQMTTTSLFLSSNIPNLVTGDLSFSDALYGLIAMEGQGFFYETPEWKVPTHFELTNILAKLNPHLADVYFAGSNDFSRWKFKNDHEKTVERLRRAREVVVSIFGNPESTEAYNHDMREAVREEIKRRFGDVSVEPTGKDGFYIPPGAPYLLQDATANVVQTLREDADTLSEVESVRKMISDGVPVSVNVQTGVLEPTPAPKPEWKKEDFLIPFYNPYKKKYKVKNIYEESYKEIISEEIYKYCSLYENKTNSKKNKIEKHLFSYL